MGIAAAHHKLLLFVFGFNAVARDDYFPLDKSDGIRVRFYTIDHTAGNVEEVFPHAPFTVPKQVSYQGQILVIIAMRFVNWNLLLLKFLTSADSASLHDRSLHKRDPREAFLRRNRRLFLR